MGATEFQPFSSCDGHNLAHFLVGPTAVGKSSVAQILAERLGRPILSADSMLVYRGMDIGTAKPTEAERSRVTCYGIDLVPPDERFSAGLYLERAREAFLACQSRGCMPIVVGGTGLYVKALLQGLDSIAANPETRKSVRALYEQKGIKGIRDAIQDHDPGLLERVKDTDNPRRMMRVLEQQFERKVPPMGWDRISAAPITGMRMKKKCLFGRIQHRVDSMYSGGLIEEALGLLETYGELSETAGFGMGYAEALAVAQKRMSIEAAKEKTALRTRQLVKRQMTWFRNQLWVTWIDVNENESSHQIADRVEEMWIRDGPATCSGLG